ncbi:MAG: hypothetical protein LBQ65_08395 [Tannerellaceae bacterium]|jgi:hypothetical protein|nr:hypothetical protein [Tannerellaceae bacterium]
MKRKICTICTLLGLFATSAFAQSFAFFKDSVPLPDNAEIEITDIVLDEITGDLLMESGLSVKNLSNAEIEATMIQSVITPPAAGEISFCFFTCLNGNVDRTQTASLKPNSFYTGLHLYFYAKQDSFTTATVKYEIFNKQSSRDKASVSIRYHYTKNSTGTTYPARLEDELRIYQQGKIISLEYPAEYKDSQLEIYKLSGQRMGAYRLTPTDRFILPVELSKGVYVFTLTRKNIGVSSHKLIIK